MIRPDRVRMLFLTIWMSFFLGMENYGILASTPYSNCYVIDADGESIADINSFSMLLDALINSTYIITI